MGEKYDTERETRLVVGDEVGVIFCCELVINGGWYVFAGWCGYGYEGGVG